MMVHCKKFFSLPFFGGTVDRDLGRGSLTCDGPMVVNGDLFSGPNSASDEMTISDKSFKLSCL